MEFCFSFFFRVMEDTPGNLACMHFILDGGVGEMKNQVDSVGSMGNVTR